jgi:hypothetical protein
MKKLLLLIITAASIAAFLFKDITINRNEKTIDLSRIFSSYHSIQTTNDKREAVGPSNFSERVTRSLFIS